MLSAKQVRAHGMRNEKWSTREKSLQYRGILKLHARDKKLQATNAEKLKRKVSRSLKELKADIEEYRKIVNDVICGDKRLLRTILQKQRDLKIQLQDAEPSDAYEVIFQDYNLKRKQLDKLGYVKVKKRQEFCNLKSEFADLSEQIEKKDEISPTEAEHQKRHQQLIARYHVTLAKRHAAKSVSDTYKEILVILKKDSKYFDVVLNALREDRRDQCRVIYKTTLMGQLAAENLDDIRQKYKQMAQDVWVNMKERERSLDSARKKVEDVWQYAKSLVRIESDTNIMGKKEDTMEDEDRRLKQQIEELENIFNVMKETMLIRSYEELFVRLEDQMKQRERLTELYNRNLKDRNFVLNKKNHAELMLQNLEHSMVSTTTKYKTEKKAMLEKIEAEKKREADNNSLIETRGELLMNIRAALQNMSSMLVCVKAAKSAGKGKDSRKAARELDDKVEIKADDRAKKDIEKEREKRTCDDPIETDGLAVLAQVTKKAITLFASTNFVLDPEKEERARDMYQNYVADYRSQLKFGDEEQEQTGMYFEHEAVDTGVPTRTEIKTKSKQIVEANTKED
ncbi:hypothetical protein TSAR_013161 [Trichomalopsis sarcophagae]|uniref:Uncharacterized protein n=1 Tax=Trichomalopsis sarcophagae TaxID=543379 RepID=A0A232FK21_9HYME|nr:hypothetical protein TSAR_013161 [Trichomalopsis sarcophagae]